jgi:hypothetical protein
MSPEKNQHVMNAIAIVFAFVSVAFLLACGCTTSVENPNEVSGAGTVVYIDLEGGFYGIIASDGSEYLPLNLPVQYQENGISVVFEGVIREDMYTIQQWGTPLDITTIQEKS